MADATLQFTTFTTPDQGGTVAVTSPSNTGHAASFADLRSCRWHALAAFDGSPRAITLKFDYSWQFVGGMVNSELFIEYTTDGGSSWIAAVHLVNANDTTGSPSVSLPIVQADKIQLRDWSITFGSHTIQVSNIRVEVDYGQSGMTGMM
jgi:hypothetical protein